MSDAADDILKGLNILMGSAVKMQSAGLAADTAISNNNAAIQLGELENEQYHHKAGLNQSSERLNKILDRQEAELKDLNKWLSERKISEQNWLNIDDMNSSLEGNALWEERGDELKNDLMVWGDVTTNAMTGIANMKDARAINDARIDQLSKMKQEYLLGAEEAALVSDKLHNDGLIDRQDFEEYVRTHAQMDGTIDTIFEHGFESMKPTADTQLQRDKSLSSLVLDGLRKEQIEQGIVKGKLDITYLEDQIDSLEDEEMWKLANRYKNVMTSLYNAGDYSGATQMRDKLYETLKLERPTSGIHDEDMSGDASVTALGPKSKSDPNAPDFEGGYTQDRVAEINTRVNNSITDHKLLNLPQVVQDNEYWEGRKYTFEELSNSKSLIQTPDDLINLQNKTIDQLIYSLDYASEGNLDYWWEKAGGGERDKKNKVWKSKSDFKGYAEKRKYLDVILPYLVSSDIYDTGGKATEYSDIGLVSSAKDAEYLDFYMENNPFNPDDYSASADAESGLENFLELNWASGKKLGYGPEHDYLIADIKFFDELEKMRKEDDISFGLDEDMSEEDMQDIVNEAMGANTERPRMTIINLTNLDSNLKSELTNSETLEDFFTMAGHDTSNDALEMAWNVYLQNANVEKLMDKDFGMEWTGSQEQKDYFLGVLKADVALSNMNKDQSSRLEESLNLLQENGLQLENNEDEQDAINNSLNMMPNRADLGPKADEQSDSITYQNVTTNQYSAINPELLNDLDKAFSSEDVVHTELENFSANISMNKEDLASFNKLRNHFPITEAEIQDSSLLINAGVGADTTRHALVTYHQLSDKYRESVPFRNYLQIYSGSKHGAAFNEVDLEQLFNL